MNAKRSFYNNAEPQRDTHYADILRAYDYLSGYSDKLIGLPERSNSKETEDQDGCVEVVDRYMVKDEEELTRYDFRRCPQGNRPAGEPSRAGMSKYERYER